MYPIAKNSEELLQFIKDNVECRLDRDHDSIFLHNSKLTHLPDWFGRIVNKRKRTNTRGRGAQYYIWKIELSHNQLTTLPNSIGNMRNVENLILSDNQISVLPSTIGNMHSLRNLYLDLNKLADLPDTIGYLYNLQRLIVSNNQLSLVPDTLADLHSLEWLFLTRNRLLYLPESLAELESLVYLAIAENYITEENLEMFDIWEITDKEYWPQKQFIWPEMEEVRKLEKPSNLYTGEPISFSVKRDNHSMWYHNRWEREFRPKGIKSLPAVPK